MLARGWRTHDAVLLGGVLAPRGANAAQGPRGDAGALAAARGARGAGARRREDAVAALPAVAAADDLVRAARRSRCARRRRPTRSLSGPTLGPLWPPSDEEWIDALRARAVGLSAARAGAPRAGQRPPDPRADARRGSTPPPAGRPATAAWISAAISGASTSTPRRTASSIASSATAPTIRAARTCGSPTSAATCSRSTFTSRRFRCTLDARIGGHGRRRDRPGRRHRQRPPDAAPDVHAVGACRRAISRRSSGIRRPGWPTGRCTCPSHGTVAGLAPERKSEVHAGGHRRARRAARRCGSVRSLSSAARPAAPAPVARVGIGAHALELRPSSPDFARACGRAHQVFGRSTDRRTVRPRARTP